MHSLGTSCPQEEDNTMDLDLDGSPCQNDEAREKAVEDSRHCTVEQSLKKSAALFLLTLKDKVSTNTVCFGLYSVSSKRNDVL